MKTAVIYCRVSTEDQEREGTSLHSQREACLVKAKELGYEAGEDSVFLETYSGLSLDRPKLDQLREWVRENKVDVVIAYTLDRLSRDPVHLVILQQELEKAEVELQLVTETVDSSDLGKLITYIKGFAAKLEAEKIKERTSRGRKTRLASGKLANGKACYLFGYDYIPGNGEGQGIRQINPRTSKVIKDIFHWFTEEGLVIDHIIYRLRDLGILSPSGKRMWARSTVWKVLKQPAYIGNVFTPGIIDQETFVKAQASLKYNREMASRNVKREYLLRGHVFCKHCGRRYQGAVKLYRTKAGLKEYQYYRCSAAHRIYAEPCHNPSWKCEYLDDIAWREVEGILSKPQVIMSGIESIGDNSGLLQQELAQCEERLKEIDGQQEQLLQWALKGFPEEAVTRENERLNQDRLNLLQRRSELESRASQIRQTKINLEDIQKVFDTVKANLGNLSFAEKRLALAALGIKLKIEKDKVLIEGSIPLGPVVSTSSS